MVVLQMYRPPGPQKMQRIKRLLSTASHQVAPRATAFAFCERHSGSVRFQVPATSDGQFPVDEAASLLAMHCLVRAQQPSDYVVLVVPERDLLQPVGDRAEELLRAGRRAAGSNVNLSIRQREVLDHILQNLSNKEIGARLHVTERTVKFHVSQLLSKFKAKDRNGLKQEAISMLPASSAPADTLVVGMAVPLQLVTQAS